MIKKFALVLPIPFLFLLVSCNSTKTTSIDFSDGSYQGEIDKKGKKHGKGIYVWHDGSTYEGDFRNDSRHGNGYFKWSNGESYKGDYFEDSRTGEGLYRWPDESYYEGSFLRGKRHGVGIFHSTDGAVYEGDWFDDMQHGEGTLTNANKKIVRAVWRNGKIITQPSILPESAAKPVLENIEIPLPVEPVQQIPQETNLTPPVSVSETGHVVNSSTESYAINPNTPTSLNESFENPSLPKNPANQQIVSKSKLSSTVPIGNNFTSPPVQPSPISRPPQALKAQRSTNSSNIWTGTVEEAEDQFHNELVNGIDTVSYTGSKEPFTGKMQILDIIGSLVGEVNLVEGQLHGEEIIIDGAGGITERILWEKGIKVE